eukprot:scaffold67829_cov16-Prasinocladus_malaysianus.AAC.1
MSISNTPTSFITPTTPATSYMPRRTCSLVSSALRLLASEFERRNSVGLERVVFGALRPKQPNNPNYRLIGDRLTSL